jgi:transcriptional regulator with GAF, ATPase, and Fis domain
VNPRPIITRSPTLERILHAAEIVAKRATPVLITGETGTGKEMLARRIHASSPRKDRPFVAVNCAALPRDLLESELFGHERGAFTGAVARKLGRFERANTGTLLLDEIGDLALDLQAKLLRVLQEKEIERIGGTASVPIDVRVIAATHRDLRAMVKDGAFRDDLFYRLSVVPLRMPALRENREDLDPLIDHFVGLFADRPLSITPEARTKLHCHAWPGNVRELENVIHRAALLCEGSEITTGDLVIEPADSPIPPTLAGRSLADVERQLLFETLAACGDSRSRAAELMGVSERTVRNWLAACRGEAELG